MPYKQYHLFKKIEQNILVVAVLVPSSEHLLTPYQAAIVAHWINLHCFDPPFSVDSRWTQGLKIDICLHENRFWLVEINKIVISR